MAPRRELIGCREWVSMKKLLTVKTEGEFNVSVGSLGGSRGVGSNTEDGFRFKAGASRLIGYSTDITVKVDAKPLIEHVKTVTVRNVQKAAEITTQAARASTIGFANDRSIGSGEHS